MLEGLQLGLSERRENTSGSDAHSQEITPSEQAGQKPTNECRFCGSTDITEGNLRIGQYRCRSCELARNEIFSIADRLAGSQKARRALPVDERAAVWARAEEIHSLGVDITRAAEKQADKIIEGDVYCITNPAWPGYVKIGEAVNAESRLRGYQTSGPFRDWKLDFAVHFEDRKLAEREILSRLDPFRVVGEDGTKGEWVEIPLADAKQAIRQLRSEI